MNPIIGDAMKTSLRSYHLPEGEVIEGVNPVPIVRTKLIAISQRDAEVLEIVGSGLCQLGAPEAGMVLLNIATAWKLV